MKRERLSEFIELIEGDSLAVLPQLDAGEFDAVVSDPPYGMNWNTDSTRFGGGNGVVPTGRSRQADRGLNYGRGDWGPVANDDVPFDPAPWLGFRKVILWGAHHYANQLPKGTTLVWLKKADALFGTFLSDADTAWMKGGYGVYCCRADGSPGSRQAEHDGRTVAHPTQKPLGLMRWCIGKAKVPPGGKILDPFAGSGTTGIAAAMEGRHCLLIEKDAHYCDVIRERVKRFECQQPGSLLIPHADLFEELS